MDKNKKMYEKDDYEKFVERREGKSCPYCEPWRCPHCGRPYITRPYKPYVPYWYSKTDSDPNPFPTVIW